MCQWIDTVGGVEKQCTTETEINVKFCQEHYEQLRERRDRRKAKEAKEAKAADNGDVVSEQKAADNGDVPRSKKVANQVSAAALATAEASAEACDGVSEEQALQWREPRAKAMCAACGEPKTANRWLYHLECYENSYGKCARCKKDECYLSNTKPGQFNKLCSDCFEHSRAGSCAYCGCEKPDDDGRQHCYTCFTNVFGKCQVKLLAKGAPCGRPTKLSHDEPTTFLSQCASCFRHKFKCRVRECMEARGTMGERLAQEHSIFEAVETARQLGKSQEYIDGLYKKIELGCCAKHAKSANKAGAKGGKSQFIKPAGSRAAVAARK